MKTDITDLGGNETAIILSAETEEDRRLLEDLLKKHKDKVGLFETSPVFQVAIYL